MHEVRGYRKDQEGGWHEADVLLLPWDGSEQRKLSNEVAIVECGGQRTDITASTAGGVLTVTALSDAPVSGDTFTIG